MNEIPTIISSSIKAIEAANGLKFKKKVHDVLVLHLAGAVVCGSADLVLLEQCLNIIAANMDDAPEVEEATEEEIEETTSDESDA
jgi:hypothetical protein